MANRFEVQVVALDRFTKVFRGLNNEASKAVRPVVNLNRQVGALAREMHLDKVASGMGKVSTAAVTMTRSVGLSLGPLESVLGIGAGGGIVGILGAAGVAALGLAVNFARTGFEVSRTSQNLGVSTRDLQRWRGAAELAHIDADAATASMAGLGDTLQDARYGRNPKAMQALNYLGIQIRRNSQGFVDTAGAMEDISRAISQIADPHVQQVVARAFGLQDALPLLRQGPEAIRALEDRAEALGVVSGPKALAWSVDFTQSIDRLKTALDGAGRSAGSVVGPFLSSGVDSFTKRLQQSQEHPLAAAAGSAYDFLAAGPRLARSAATGLFNAASHGTFGDAARTTPDQRSVSGAIGGPLQNGAYRPPAGAFTGANAGAGDGSRFIDPTVQAERDREALRVVQDELAGSTNATDRAALQREIARRQAGAASGTLNAPADPTKVHVEVAFKNAPPGVTATAKTSGNAYVPTRVSYSMAEGDMP